MIRRLAEDLVLAVTFMTRLPLPVSWVRPHRRLSQALWAMPVGGAFIGSIGAAFAIAASAANLDTTLSAILAITAMTIVSGALHEDGFADFCDGLGGGKTPSQRLEIMRDSRIGTYGAMALILAAACLITVTDELLIRTSERKFLAILIIAGALSRAAIVIPFACLKPARTDGLSQHFGHPSSLNMIIGISLPAAIAIALLGLIGLAIVIGALAGAVIITILARYYLGGYTGDVFGAAIVLGLIGALLVARAFS